MKVIINGSVYGMERKQLVGVLDIAMKQVKCGIYAIEKDGVCELKNEAYEDAGKLHAAVKEYEEEDFIVYYNE